MSEKKSIGTNIPKQFNKNKIYWLRMKTKNEMSKRNWDLHKEEFHVATAILSQC